MTEKYYTPDLSEFHVGFEYEYKSSKVFSCFGDTKHNWEKETFTGVCNYMDEESEFHDIEEAINGDKFREVRVKLLDKTDIEDLGWILTKEGTPFSKKDLTFSKTFEIGFNTGTVYTLVKYHNQTQLHLKWEQYSSYVNDKGSISINIKNKTELKKLMEQLGINK